MVFFHFPVCFWVMARTNFINHNRFIITKNVEGVDGFTEDVVSFMQYVYAVKTGWDPQFSSIVKNKETVFPDLCYKNNDSLKLESVIYLAKTCGSGFSRKATGLKKLQKKNQIVTLKLRIYLIA